MAVMAPYRDTIQAAANLTQNYEVSVGLSCSPEKSEMLCIRPKNRNWPCSPIVIELEGRQVPEVQALRILGMHIQSGGKNSTTLRRLKQVIGAISHLIRRVKGHHRGMRERDLCRLVHAFVLSRVRYSTPYLQLSHHETDAMDALIHQKRSRGSRTSQLRSRHEPAASTPAPGAPHCYPEAEASTESTEMADTVPISLSSDEEPELMSLSYSDDSGRYLSSRDEEDIETVRCSTPFEGSSSVEPTAGSMNSDSPTQVLSLSSDGDIEIMRCRTPFEGSSSVATTAGSIISDSPPSVSVAPHYGSPVHGPLNSTTIEGGVPINIMSSPSTSATPVPLAPPPRDLTNEPSTSARARPLTPLRQSEDEQSSTMTQAIPPCPLGLHRQAQLREMRRYNVHFTGFLPRQK
ncbi:hypothetical protein HPB49_001876 [Dermacentor silvarum]|uniref:Uncharacterized protein n=1 Tax=Dermacentor silvarum TaxID=543639 RepID=A0ACB8DT23_DERSI|nr:hypothetical protein HPB49_001876 [Dermacentor silvarum]